MSFPQKRLRRLRSSKAMRRLVQETRLSTNDLVCPIFVQEDIQDKIPIDSMPELYRLPLNQLAEEIKEIISLKIPAVMVFGIPSKKDNDGTSAFAKDGIVQRAITEIRKAAGDKLIIMADVCLCQYTTSGHCGIINNEMIDNDTSIKTLGKIATSLAQAGADIVSPSAMMDGQVGIIREQLDNNGLFQVGIMPHSAKHQSSFYSPFRDAAECAPKSGDRKTYQVPFTNQREALAEVQQDVEEGADIVMIKPALAYLDLISKSREMFNIPIAAYSVSGEYALVKAAAQKNWINQKDITLEILYGIKRAGADIIITYFAKTAAKYINES